MSTRRTRWLATSVAYVAFCMVACGCSGLDEQTVSELRIGGDPMGIMSDRKIAPGQSMSYRVWNGGGPPLRDGVKWSVVPTVPVYLPAEHLLVGTWSERAIIECGTGHERPEFAFALRLYATGDFHVYLPHSERSVAMYGTYRHDSATDHITFAVSGGYSVPSDVRGNGTFELTGKTLRLHDIWLGPSPHGPTGCGYILEKVSG